MESVYSFFKKPKKNKINNSYFSINNNLSAELEVKNNYTRKYFSELTQGNNHTLKIR